MPSFAHFNGLYSKNELIKIKNMLQKELKRSELLFESRKKPPVYYMSYLYRNEVVEKIFARVGGICEHSKATKNNIYCDIRTGTPRYDNITEGGLFDNDPEAPSAGSMDMPYELDEDSFRYSVWLLTDKKYGEAAEQYFDRKAREVYYRNPYKNLQSCAINQRPIKDFRYVPLELVDTEYWKYILRKASGLAKKHPQIKFSLLYFSSRHTQKIFVNSNGSEILQQSTLYELHGDFIMLTSKGESIPQHFSFVAGNGNDLPDEKQILQAVKTAIEKLFLLAKAPVLNSYSGPVFLMPGPAGLFFHEVIGHRLEGSRLLSTREGRTFADLYGKKITPEFIDIFDDPGQKSFKNRSMIGRFQYDDEGHKAERAHLIEAGILRNFLTTAAQIPGQQKSNGHARNQYHERPISRMGNLFIENREPVNHQQMKERFMREIKDQKKEYGIMVYDTLGGETGTGNYDFQAFKGEIMNAARVFPDGREQLVRGVDFVGTPLSTLQSIDCMGDSPELENSFCGAESGMIPVSTVCPSALIKNLELQSKDSIFYQPHHIPLPYETGSSK